MNRSSNRNKRSILSALLLVYFVVYAMSPLCGTYTGKKIVDGICTANGTSYSGENLNILLLEIICARIDVKKDQSHSTVRVLIRKARAILPENVNLSFASLGLVTLFEDISSLFDNSSSRLLAPLNEQKVILECDLLHSGPSPPIA